MVLDSSRWDPYEFKGIQGRRGEQVESICGKFIAMSGGLNQRAPLVDGRLSSVCFKVESPFGLQTE